MTSNLEVYEAVTRRMITALEQGTIPWARPWTAASGGRPHSISSGMPYRGINTLLLGLQAMDKGYGSPWWGTYDAIARHSGMVKQRGRWVSPDGTPRGVRKGEKGTQVVLWKDGRVTEKDPDTGEKVQRRILLARFYYVFNADQAVQLPDRYYPAVTGVPVEEIADAQQVLDGYLASGGPQWRHVAGNRAYYQPEDDMITMPGRDQFPTPQAYYGTAFHEAGHSTGHADRLGRDGVAGFDHFGSDKYGKEELIAQMTSAMLQAATGTETDEEFTRSAAYVGSWLKAIKGDAKLVPQAAAAAQRAVDLITGQAASQPEDAVQVAA